MVSVGQPSITVIIIFKCNNRGRTKGKLLRTTLVVEQKENSFSRPAQLSPSTPLVAACPSKNNPHGFLIWTKSTHTRSSSQGGKRRTIFILCLNTVAINKKWKACNFCFRETVFWTQIKVVPMHENFSLLCVATVKYKCSRKCLAKRVLKSTFYKNNVFQITTTKVIIISLIYLSIITIK